MGFNQRIYQRFVINRPAKCFLFKSAKDHFSAQVVDIGPEGIGLVLERQLEMGTNIHISISLENDEEITISATVVWVKEAKEQGCFRVGARVIDARQEDLEKFIRFYCLRLFPLPDNKGKKNPDC